MLIHGVIVALVAGQEFWTMFAFGFLFLLVVTQMHGLGLSRVTKWLIALFAIAATVVVYSDRGWANLNEVLRIPLIDYLMVGFLGGLLIVGKLIFQRSQGKSQETP